VRPGCAQAQVPPPSSTVWDDVSRWAWEGKVARVHHALCVALREQAGREASPTTAIIDGRTAKGATQDRGEGRVGDGVRRAVE
jgi:hypothetical protein